MNNFFTLRYFFILVFFISTVATEGFSQKTLSVSPRLSFDVSGSHKASSQGQNISINSKTGFSLGLEIVRNSENLFKAGLGISYLLDRELENSNGEKFNFVPLYGLAKFDLIEKKEDGDNIIPSIVGTIGYNIVYGGNDKYKGPFTLKGGIYLGGGLRIEGEQLYAEGMYRSFSGSADLNLSGQSLTVDVSYSTFSVTLGITL